MSIGKSEDVDEGISLSDFLLAIGRRATFVALVALTGGLIGMGAAMLLPKQWQAVVLVQIGQVGQIPVQLGQVGQVSAPIESATRALERIRTPSFLNQLSEHYASTGSNPHGNAGTAFMLDSLKVSVPRGTDWLELRVSGYTREGARSAAAQIVALLKRQHARLAEPSIAWLNGQHQKLESELAERIKERAMLEKVLVNNPRAKSAGGSTDALFTVLISLKDTEIRSLRDSKLRVGEALSPARTFETAAITEIGVSERPTFPRPTQFGLAGAGLGLIVAIGWVLYRRREASSAVRNR